MTYRGLIAARTGEEAYPRNDPEVKWLDAPAGLRFPVVLSRERMHRPFLDYPVYTRENCPLCARVESGRARFGIVPDMAWLPASFPIKSFHAICYPGEHRSAILAHDIEVTGRFVELAGDAVAGLNVRGSAASIPEHSHSQIHDFELPRGAGNAFPMLACDLTPIGSIDGVRLSQVAGYPAFALALEGDWELLGRFVPLYLGAANQRPHNFALAPGGRLYVIPRGLEHAPGQENRFGASEMLGMITPVSEAAYAAVGSGAAVCEALRVCGLTGDREKIAAREHAEWVCANLGRVCEAGHACS